MLDTLDTAKSLAEFLNISVAQVRKMCRTTDVPIVRIGCSVRFDREEVMKWLKERDVQENGHAEAIQAASSSEVA